MCHPAACFRIYLDLLLADMHRMGKPDILHPPIRAIPYKPPGDVQTFSGKSLVHPVFPQDEYADGLHICEPCVHFPHQFPGHTEW